MFWDFLLMIFGIWVAIVAIAVAVGLGIWGYFKLAYIVHRNAKRAMLPHDIYVNYDYTQKKNRKKYRKPNGDSK
jgi:hypothetical protein